MSDFGTTTQPAGASRGGQARELIDQAGSTLKHEARSFAHAAQDRVRTEAHRGAQAAGRTLGDFANAVRRAGDDLGQSDHSPASRLVMKAADGLETFSRSLADKDPGDLLNAVRDFGRRNPMAFIGGAVLVGLAVGRFARASERQGEVRRFSDDDEATVEPIHLAESPYDPTLVPSGDADLAAPADAAASGPIPDSTSDSASTPDSAPSASGSR
ncbi:hypothetical protein [Phenylobacterium sp.]|uniref:hypothetical protein n=1 Tax=Phenylobacterium sp. TaxID=1871053 RepID=UPI00301D7962